MYSRTCSFSLRLLALSAVAALAAAGCHRAPASPPVATATLTLSRTRVPLGSPLNLHYHFTVAPGAALDEDYWVMVHFVNADGDLMWTDDHQPPVPTSHWKPGQVIDYSRTMFVPVYPYVGPASVEIGLYSRQSQRRLTLDGDDVGQHAYKVATLDVLPQTANVPLSYLVGWHNREVASGQMGISWRWTEKEAELSFPNPKQDSTFFLDLDNSSGAFPDPQQVTVSLGDQVVAQFALKPKVRQLQQIPISAAELGPGPTGTIRIAVDKAFVPARMPAMNNADPRELGVRVFQAFLLPKSQ